MAPPQERAYRNTRCIFLDGAMAPGQNKTKNMPSAAKHRPMERGSVRISNSNHVCFRVKLAPGGVRITTQTKPSSPGPQMTGPRPRKGGQSSAKPYRLRAGPRCRQRPYRNSSHKCTRRRPWSRRGDASKAKRGPEGVPVGESVRERGGIEKERERETQREETKERDEKQR